MPRITIIRHGESTGNVDPNASSGRKIHLTQLGGEQARAAGRSLKDKLYQKVGRVLQRKHGGRPVQLIASPFRRTRQTARSIAGYIGHKGTIPTHKGLGERHFGVVAQQRPFDLNTQPGYRLGPRRRPDENWKPKGGESLVDTQRRAVGALHDLMAKHHGKDLVIVTHGHVAKSLQHHFEGGDWSKHVPRWENCTSRTFDYEPRAVAENRVDSLILMRLVRLEE